MSRVKSSYEGEQCEIFLSSTCCGTPDIETEIVTSWTYWKNRTLPLNSLDALGSHPPGDEDPQPNALFNCDFAHGEPARVDRTSAGRYIIVIKTLSWLGFF